MLCIDISLVRGGEARATALLSAKINELHLVCFFVCLTTFLSIYRSYSSRMLSWITKL